MPHASPSHLSRLLTGWSAATAGTARRPLPELLAEALRDLAERGDLAAGTVLPSQRALASVLGISRATVTAAYGALEAEGRLESRQGSGSRLRGTPLTRERAGEGRLASFDERRPTGDEDGEDTASLDLSSGALGSIGAVGEAVDALGSGDLGALLDSDGYLPYGLRWRYSPSRNGVPRRAFAWLPPAGRREGRVRPEGRKGACRVLDATHGTRRRRVATVTAPDRVSTPSLL